MAAQVKWKPNPEPDVASYNIYKSINQTAVGPYNLIGNVLHDSLAVELLFSDSLGTIDDYYKLTTVNDAAGESLASNAFKPFAQADLTRLYDTIFDAARKPKANVKVEARLDATQASFNGIVVPTVVIAVTDSNGVWFMDLFPNSSLSPAGTEYLISIGGISQPQSVVVPVAPIVSYSSLVSL